MRVKKAPVSCRRRNWTAAAAVPLQLWIAAPALAHSGERGQVLLLPTQYYIWGGGLVVLASVVAVAVWQPRGAPSGGAKEVTLPLPGWLGTAASVVVFALFAGLILAGSFGPPDPLSNPLPGFVWGLFWLAFSAVTLLAGNLWPAVNPWRWLTGVKRNRPALLAYPAWLGCWPALVQFLIFAWVELVDPWANDPRHLAMLCLIYLAYNAASTVLYGAAWLEQAEPFAVYFRMIGRLSPLQWRFEAEPSLRIVWPGAAVATADSPSPSEALFVLVALATVSFDGFSHTFTWMGWLGLNPLDFEGRTSVVVPNTLGLLLMATALASAFAIAVQGVPRAGRYGLALAIVPIAVAYHIAHYLPDAPVIVLRALKALSDPFGTGQDLLGTGHLSPPASVMNNFAVVQLIYRTQTAAIVVGHIAAVVLGHVRIAALGLPRRAAIRAELPLNLLMVAYTFFGLWLLSTATIS